LGPILDIHEQDYVEYLQTIYDEWVAEGLPGDTVISDTFPHPSVIGKIDPAIYRKTAKLSAPGKMGLFNFDMSVAFVKGNSSKIHKTSFWYN
jgi:hypothetical protein